MGKTDIVAIGDSITYGYPYTPQQSWVAISAKRLEISIMNKGVCGDTTIGMMARFKRDVISHSPDYSIILGGTNDAYCGILLEDAFECYQYMIEQCDKHHIIPTIGLPIPCNDMQEEAWLKQFRYKLNSYGVQRNIKVIDFYEPLCDTMTGHLKQGIHIDGIHPNVRGYEIMAAKLIDAW